MLLARGETRGARARRGGTTILAAVGIVTLGLAVSNCDAPGGHSDADAFQAALHPDALPSDANTGTDAAAGADTAGLDEAASAVCERWIADRAFLTEGRWSGRASTCEAGEWPSPGPENTLRQVNLHRFLAGLPPVELDARKSADAQACALMMDANDDILHEIPTSWDCRSAAGVDAAGLSNLATTPGVASIALYMVDNGVETLGHRRWILSNSLGPIGVGSTNAFSCLHVIGGEGSAGAAWTAWPPPGPVPLAALHGVWWAGVDEAGWSVQSDRIDLRQATVTVTVDGEEMPVSQWTLARGYGSEFGLGFTPVGWHTTEGVTYHVEVSGAREPIAYDVAVVGCGD
ncbi:MAG: CAP domain-containing protein [Myxococcales bacterium]|nr:CAP domain-containing protein [Myxococcales bacterium]MCB9737501.1 CAP domain-containing protein [Deltaproteobacteria bacterium]